MRNALFLLTCLGISLSATCQTTWYVSNEGMNSNSGLSQNESFLEINYALSQASCGDSLYVLVGDYYEKIQATAICPENNRIIIQGDISEKPTVIGDAQANNRYAVSALGEGYYFRNFRMTSPFPMECSQSNQVIVGNGDHFTFDDIEVFNSGYDGIKTYGECTEDDFAENWKILNCSIYNCGLGCPEEVVNGDGIDFTQCRNCQIDNCVIKDNKGHQLQIKLEAENVSITNSHIEGVNMFQIGLSGNVAQCDPEAFNANNITIERNTILAKGSVSEWIFKLADVTNFRLNNNTIIKDSISDVNVGFICFGGCSGSENWTNTPTSPVEIKSNVFANFSVSPFEFGPDTTFFDPFSVKASEVTMDFNLFFDVNSQLTSPIDGGENSLVSDPLFCDYPNSYEIQINSPCVDAGDPSLAPDPDGSLNDIGARFYNEACMDNSVLESEFYSEQLMFYPNPFKNEVMLEGSTIKSLKVLSLSGKELLSLKPEKNQRKVNLSQLSAGIYVLIFEHDLGNYSVQRGVKQ